MKKYLILICILNLLSVTTVKAENFRTCTNNNGAESCTEATVEPKVETIVQKHQVVDTGFNFSFAFKLIGGTLALASVSSYLYKATYKNYIFG